MFAGWFAGPQMVEQYHYASAKGRLRAEYENASTLLEGDPLKQVSLAYQLVAQKVQPSVVSIQARKPSAPGTWLEGFGSGVIMSPEGHIITNAHVLDGATRCLVELHDRRRYVATVIGSDEAADLAVLQINAEGLIPAQWGDSDAVTVGSIVWAIGSPFRFQQTITSGIVSGKDRPGIDSPDTTGLSRWSARKQNLLQTDAAVNPGNSGGPLVDSSGHVIGINTSIYGDTFQGISFAVPSATAKFVFHEILDRGIVDRGYFGVSPSRISHAQAIELDLPDLDGALIQHVETGSPAELAGIIPMDVIRTWDGQEITQYNNLYRLAEMSSPGSVVPVTVIRDGKMMTTDVTVGRIPTSDQIAPN